MDKRKHEKKHFLYNLQQKQPKQQQQTNKSSSLLNKKMKNSDSNVKKLYTKNHI